MILLFGLLLVLAFSTSVYADRFELAGEIITDTQTDLEWRVGPGEGTTWYEANDWVDGLGNGWRMPTVDELEEIHKAGIWRDDMGYFDSGAINIWAGNTWSSEISGVYCLDPVSSALTVSFVDGGIYEVSKQDNFTGVFAVQIHTQVNPSASEPRHIYTDSSAGDTFSGPLSGMTFAYIPSGIFQMGSPSSEQDRYFTDTGECYESPYHEVQVNSFEIMTTEVTQAMWETVMGTTVNYMCRAEGPLYGEGDDYPMYYLSWNDCQDFKDAMNDIDTSHIYRLPTEEEWEYACRAGTDTRFYWGNDPDYTQIEQYAVYWNEDLTSLPVAQKLPNAWGLYDMSGNVHEWCYDEFDYYDNSPTDDGAYAVMGFRVLRGGGWEQSARCCRSAMRNYGGANAGNFSLGFRLTRSERFR